MAQKSVGSVNVPDLSAAIGLPSIPATAKYAILQADVQALRYWMDGTVPTATTGILLAAGASVTLSGKLANVQMIQATAGAKANIMYMSS